MANVSRVSLYRTHEFRGDEVRLQHELNIGAVSRLSAVRLCLAPPSLSFDSGFLQCGNQFGKFLLEDLNALLYRQITSHAQRVQVLCYVWIALIVKFHYRHER